MQKTTVAPPRVIDERFRLTPKQMDHYKKRNVDCWEKLDPKVAIGEILDRAESFIDRHAGREIIDCFWKNTGYYGGRFAVAKYFSYNDGWQSKTDYFIGGTSKRGVLSDPTFSLALEYWYHGCGAAGGVLSGGGLDLMLYCTELQPDKTDTIDISRLNEGHIATITTTIDPSLANDGWSGGIFTTVRDGKGPFVEGSLDFLTCIYDDMKIRLEHYKKKGYGAWKNYRKNEKGDYEYHRAQPDQPQAAQGEG